MKSANYREIYGYNILGLCFNHNKLYSRERVIVKTMTRYIGRSIVEHANIQLETHIRKDSLSLSRLSN